MDPPTVAFEDGGGGGGDDPPPTYEECVLDPVSSLLDLCGSAPSLGESISDHLRSRVDAARQISVHLEAAALGTEAYAPSWEEFLLGDGDAEMRDGLADALVSCCSEWDEYRDSTDDGEVVRAASHLRLSSFECLALALRVRNGAAAGGGSVGPSIVGSRLPSLAPSLVSALRTPADGGGVVVDDGGTRDAAAELLRSLLPPSCPRDECPPASVRDLVLIPLSSGPSPGAAAADALARCVIESARAAGEAAAASGLAGRRLLSGLSRAEREENVGKAVGAAAADRDPAVREEGRRAFWALHSKRAFWALHSKKAFQSLAERLLSKMDPREQNRLQKMRPDVDAEWEEGGRMEVLVRTGIDLGEGAGSPKSASSSSHGGRGGAGGSRGAVGPPSSSVAKKLASNAAGRSKALAAAKARGRAALKERPSLGASTSIVTPSARRRAREDGGGGGGGGGSGSGGGGGPSLQVSIPSPGSNQDVHSHGSGRPSSDPSPPGSGPATKKAAKAAALARGGRRGRVATLAGRRSSATPSSKAKPPARHSREQPPRSSDDDEEEEEIPAEAAGMQWASLSGRTDPTQGPVQARVDQDAGWCQMCGQGREKWQAGVAPF